MTSMLRHSLAPLAVLLSGAHLFAQQPAAVPLVSGARPTATAVVLPVAPQAPGSDACATPVLVVGNGPHNFDTSGMTTGPEGQGTTNCTNTGFVGIDSDVWFEWVAPTTGAWELTTCGLTLIDTKVAVYAGTSSGVTCPTAGTLAVDCNDDITSLPVTGGTLTNLRSRVTINVTAGTHYLIQIGGKNSAPPALQGAGQFQLDPVPAQPPYSRGDGSPEVVYRLVAPATDTLWMQAQGDMTTGPRSVIAVRTAAGAIFAATQSGVVDGNPITLGVWEDPNDDGLPGDAVLLATWNDIVSLANTNQLATYVIPTPVTVDNIFFVGAAYSHGSGVGFPAPVDSNGCAARPNQAFLCGNAGPVDFMNLGVNTFAPGSLTTTSSVAFLTEADTISTFTGTVFCNGDGVAPHTACPCGNNSPTVDDVGCLSSLGVGGKLRAMGSPSIAADSVVLQGSQMPNSTVLYFQGVNQQNGGNGTVFGDGLRCAGGSIMRLGSIVNVGGASTYPSGAQASVSVKGGIVSPVTRTYQGWYRNAAAFCLPSTFNLTNGIEIVWQP
jgi:hypothetical protein